MSTNAIWRPSRWTLRTKLVAWMLLLFIAVTAAVGALTVWQLNKTLLSQMDNQLISSSSSNQTINSGMVGGDGRGPRGAAPGIQVVTLTSGKLAYLAAYTSTTFGSRQPWAVTINNVTGGSSQRSLTTAQVTRLTSAGVGGSPTTVDLGGKLGDYRVVARLIPNQPVYQTHTEGPLPDGTPAESVDVISIVGLPLSTNSEVVQKTALAVALLSGAGVVLVALAATYIVQRNLEPLRRVAATATRVSKLPLSSGEVVMSERVDPRDTDKRTEVGQVGASLNDMLDHVDNALSARQASEMQVRQFVADASHELRTPLASIRGYAELSRRETDPVPPGVTHALGRIESEAGRMTTLVEDLLLLARLDAGRQLDFQPVELPIIAIETVSDARAAGPDHQWALDLPEEGVEIEADEARIRQILINLLGNARKHTPAGTHVVVAVQSRGDHVLLQVRDDGPGIPPDLVPHIFERFTRGDLARTRTEGSTGLGLSIVSAVVAAHHGTVEVTSRPGETVFSIRLPHRQSAPDPAAAAQPSDPRVSV